MAPGPGRRDATPGEAEALQPARRRFIFKKSGWGGGKKLAGWLRAKFGRFRGKSNFRSRKIHHVHHDDEDRARKISGKFELEMIAGAARRRRVVTSLLQPINFL